MSIKIYKSKKINDILFYPGNFFSFKYRNFLNDPEPLILYLNNHFGIHENTGHKHQYIQGINLHYIPKNIRFNFVTKWLDLLTKNERYIMNNFNLLWEKWIQIEPRLKPAFRRYLYYPEGIIYSIDYIKNKHIFKFVNKSIEKEFFDKDKILLANKWRMFNKVIKIRKK